MEKKRRKIIHDFDDIYFLDIHWRKGGWSVHAGVGRTVQDGITNSAREREMAMRAQKRENPHDHESSRYPAVLIYNNTATATASVLECITKTNFPFIPSRMKTEHLALHSAFA